MEGHPEAETSLRHPTHGQPPVLLGLQGDWEPQVTSVGVRKPPSAPPPWGDIALPPAPTGWLPAVHWEPGTAHLLDGDTGLGCPPGRLRMARGG